MAEETTTMQLAGEIEKLRHGDMAARDRLLAMANDRLVALASRMLRSFPRVRRFNETSDVAQKATLRLRRALEQVQIRDVNDYLRLAALQIRRELEDLARQLANRPELTSMPEKPGEVTVTLTAAQSAEATQEPRQLALWAAFHAKVGQLPERERTVFELRWYQNLEMSEIAEQLGIPEATVKRTWLAAQRKLHDLLGGEVPG